MGRGRNPGYPGPPAQIRTQLDKEKSNRAGMMAIPHPVPTSVFRNGV